MPTDPAALPPAALTFLARHHHVASRAELRALGCPDHRIDGMLDRSVLVSPFRGVLALPRRDGGGLRDVLADPSSAARAACLASRSAVVSHLSAGHLWGLPVPPPGRLHVSVPAHTHLQLRPAVVRRSTAMEAQDVVTWPDGIRLTSVPRTLFDLAAVLGPGAVRQAAERALADGRTTVPELWATARRLCRSGRPGSSTFADVLAGNPAWAEPCPPARHPAVHRLGAALVAAGLPAPATPWEVPLPGGATVRFPLGFPDLRAGVAVDFRSWHGGRVDGPAVRLERRRLARVGVRVVDVSDVDLAAADDTLVDRIADGLRGRPAPGVGWAGSLPCPWPCAS